MPPMQPTPGSGPAWIGPHPPSTHPIPRDGRRHCGHMEAVLRRQWDPAAGLPPQILIAAVDRIAALPAHLAFRLVQWLDGGLWLGDGQVPDLDALGFLHGQPVREGSAARWDNEPGALIGRTVVIGTGDHLSVDLLGHELGHAFAEMDELTATPAWQAIMWRCRPQISYHYYQDAAEFFAESFAHVWVGEPRRLTRLLSGDSAAMEMVWAYHQRELGVGLGV